MLKPVFIALILLATHAQGAVYKCQAPDGRYIFSDRPCASQTQGAKQLEHRKSEYELAIEAYQKEEAERKKQEEAKRLEAQKIAEQLAKEQHRRAIEKAVATAQELQQWREVPQGNGNIVTNSGWDGSVWQIEEFLQTTLKDPDSFEAIQWGVVYTKHNKEYRVRCKYRAKNSYGGYVVAHKVFALNAKGTVLYQVDYTGKHLGLY